MCTYGAERASDLLELELEMVLSCQIGAGNWTRDSLQEKEVLLTAEPQDIFQSHPALSMCFEETI